MNYEKCKMKELSNFSICLSIINIVKSSDESTNRFNIREKEKKKKTIIYLITIIAINFYN
jgi:hypothetical protein